MYLQSDPPPYSLIHVELIWEICLGVIMDFLKQIAIALFWNIEKTKKSFQLKEGWL